MQKTHVASGGSSTQLTKNRTRLAASCTLADSYTCHHYKVNDGNRAADFSSEKNVLFHRRLHSEAERCLCVSGGSLWLWKCWIFVRPVTDQRQAAKCCVSAGLLKLQFTWSAAHTLVSLQDVVDRHSRKSLRCWRLKNWMISSNDLLFSRKKLKTWIFAA